MRFFHGSASADGYGFFFGCTGHRGVFTDAVMSVKSG